MSMTVRTLGIAGALVMAGIVSVFWQRGANARLRFELDRRLRETREIAALQQENQRLARTAAEFTALRQVAVVRQSSGDFAAAAGPVGARRELRAATPASLPASSTGSSDTDPDTAMIYEPSQLDVPPRAKSTPRPAYPAEMRRAGIAGNVLVDVIIDASGQVRDAYVVESSHPEFAAAALDAVSRGKFGSGEKSGQAVHTHLQIPIHFGPPAKAP